MLSDELLSPRSVHPAPVHGHVSTPPLPPPSSDFMSLCSSQTSSYCAQDPHHESTSISLLHPQFSVLEELNRTQRLHQLWQSNLANYDFATSPSPPAWKVKGHFKPTDAQLEDDTMLSPPGLPLSSTSLAPPLLPALQPASSMQSMNNNSSHLIMGSALLSLSNPPSQPVSARSSPYPFLLSPPPSVHFLSPPPAAAVLLSSAILSADSLSAQSSNNGNSNLSQSFLSNYQSLTPSCSKPPSRQPSCDSAMLLSSCSNIIASIDCDQVEAAQQLAHIQSSNFSKEIVNLVNGNNSSPAVEFEFGLIPHLPPITLPAKKWVDRTNIDSRCDSMIAVDQHVSAYKVKAQLYQSTQNSIKNIDPQSVLTAQVMRAVALANAAGSDEIDSLELPQLSSATSSSYTTPTTSVFHSRSNSPLPISTSSGDHSMNSVLSPIANGASESSTIVAGIRSKYTKVCPFAGCNARFPKESTLQRHIRCHTGEKPFRCVVDGCDAAFSEKGNLLRHEASAHRNERKFTCPFPYCLTEFRRAAHVEQHVQTQHVSRGEDVSRAYSYLKPPEKSRKRSKVVGVAPSTVTATKFETSASKAEDDGAESNSASFNILRGRQLVQTNRFTTRSNHHTTSPPSASNVIVSSMSERGAVTVPLSPISPAKKKQRGSKSV